jgi:alpha 1,2-mannosyltransferase
MQDQQKVYGFTLSLFEYVETIPTLWDAVKEFIELHPEHVAENNAMKFLSGDGGETYNLCHFWSNFEIGDLRFWRSQAYIDFFNHLDKLGGFYYERWGDAPVHSIAAALFAPKDKIHWFEDIGYRHEPFQVSLDC